MRLHVLKYSLERLHKFRKIRSVDALLYGHLNIVHGRLKRRTSFWRAAECMNCLVERICLLRGGSNRYKWSFKAKSPLKKSKYNKWQE